MSTEETSSSSNTGEERRSCPICLDAIIPNAPDVTQLPCTHVLHSSCAISLFRHGLPNCPICRDNGRSAGEEGDSNTTEGTDSDIEYEDMVNASTLYASIPSLKRMVSSILRDSSISRAPVSVRSVLRRCKKQRDEMQAARRSTREFEIRYRREVKTLNRLRRTQATRERRFREAVRAALLA